MRRGRAAELLRAWRKEANGLLGTQKEGRGYTTDLFTTINGRRSKEE